VNRRFDDLTLEGWHLKEDANEIRAEAKRIAREWT
jgi:hypothetical protein